MIGMMVWPSNCGLHGSSVPVARCPTLSCPLRLLAKLREEEDTVPFIKSFLYVVQSFLNNPA